MKKNPTEMSDDEVRNILLAKIARAWPGYLDNPKIARAVELGSNADLRKHLAMAEILRDTPRAEPSEWVEPSPRIPADEAAMMRRVLTTRTGNELAPHRYVLARDECDWYVGPSWVPFNLWRECEYSGYGHLVQECARKLLETAGAEALWGAIAKQYVRPDRVSTSLAVVCADALESWRQMPRDTPSEYKVARDELARRADQLALELERFFLPRDPDKHEWPGLLDFRQLMTEQELDDFDRAIRFATFQINNRAREAADVRRRDWEEYNDIGSSARKLGYQPHDLYTPARIDAFNVYELLIPDHTRPELPYGGVPTLPQMLRRIAGKFREDGQVPPLSRPNFANAERNFFTRFLCKYFWTSFGDVSPAVVRDIVSMFYSQGIRENDVSQILGGVKRDHPLPIHPEDSHLK